MPIPFQPQPDNPVTYGMKGILPVARVQYNIPQPPPPPVNVSRVVQAIRNNESAGTPNPYLSSQPSGAGDMANGAYRVRDAELKTYAPKYLGRAVSSQEFRSNPTLQDTYMTNKVTSLAGRGLTAAQIMAVHRGGGSDLTANALTSLEQKYNPYVQKGMQYYNSPTVPSRSFQDLSH